MKTGVELIAAERTRKIEKERWSLARDVAEHYAVGLAQAASCYAMPPHVRRYTEKRSTGRSIPIFWPWDACWWKPTPEDRVRELVKAGALITAEIDRLRAGKVGAK